MDALPPEIVAHVLSFQEDGKGVSLFKRLNSRFCGIIKGYRSLRRPAFNIYVQNVWNHSENIITIGLTGFWHCNIDVSNVNSIVIAEHRNSRRINLLFGPLFQRNPYNQSLKSFFMFIFEHIDVKDLFVVGLHNGETIRTLSDSIRETNTRVACVLYSLDCTSFPELCDLLTEIGNLNLIHREKSTIRCICASYNFQEYVPTNFQKHLPRILKINEISTLYKSSRLDVDTSDAGQYMCHLAEEWRKNPSLKFSFDLCAVKEWADGAIMLPVHFPKTEQFDVEIKNKMYLFDCEDDVGYVRFKDWYTDRFVIFKKNKSWIGRDPYYNHPYSKKVLFSIDVVQ